MTTWCEATGGYTCPSNGVQGAKGTRNIDLPACSCIKDEETIKKTYCDASSSITSPEDLCDDPSTTTEYLPVTCFGKNCSSEGYRFQRMRNQKCTVTLCEQLVDVVGTEISVKADLNLYCGTEPDSIVTSDNTSDNTSDDTSTNTTENPEFAIWIIAGIALIVFGLVLPLAYVTYKRTHEYDRVNKPLDLTGKGKFNVSKIKI